MKVVHKFIFDSTTTTNLDDARTRYAEFSLPVGARILHSHMQRGRLCLWAEVNLPVDKLETRLIAVYATGATVPSHARYIGTFDIEDYALVFHVFEVTTAKSDLT